MARVFRAFIVLFLLVAVGIGGFAAFAWRGEIDPVEPPSASSFPPETLRRGAELAAIGNCNVCHTAEGGQPFAGGRGMETPFGTIYATNITPDPETGIGQWSQEAFHRSMREGVDREGNHLYPAFPYDHFTRVTDEDNDALYAYLMTQEPVRADTPANEVAFPFNVRPLIAGWKLLYFDEGPFEPDPSRDEAWNRGAYLAEGLGHCGACHTPRDALGAVDNDRHYDGAEIEGWYAYALNEQSPAPTPWTTDAMAFYLAHGWHERHGVSRGPMAPVTSNLSAAPQEDVDALAVYVVSQMGEAGEEAPVDELEPIRAAPSGDSQIAPPPAQEAGAAIYEAACAICHDAGRPLPYGGLSLDRSTAMNGPNPQNIINVTLYGLPAAEGEAGPVMPGYKGALDEDQLVALIDYMRARFTEAPPWEDTRERVQSVLSGETEIQFYRSHGAGGAPTNVGREGVSW